MFKISDKTFVLTMTLLYAGVIVFISSFHVVWRDEVVPMTQVMGCSSLADLWSKAHGFGHPLLWYFLLYLGYQWVHSFCVLKIVNILVCVGAIYLFLSKAPFSRLQKVLFILGFFPLYLYPVFNRDYAISMLLIFAFASLYPKRFVKMIPLGGVLFLLANAHAHSLITAIAILAALVAEFIFCLESRRAWQAHLTETYIGFALIMAGILFSTLYVIPNHNNIVYSPHPLGIKELAGDLFKSVFIPGKAFISVLGVPSVLFTTFAVFSMYFYLVSKPYLLILFSFAVIGLNFFYHVIFPSDEMRHQGALYLLLITIFWIEAYVTDLHSGNIIENFRDSLVHYKRPYFIILLVLQICLAYPAVTNELSTVYSSSESFGALLKSPAFKDAVLVGEPGAMLEAVPYYADNFIYLPRERVFRKYTEFTTDQSPQYSLAQLLTAAENVKAKTRKMVLIVMGHKLSSQGPFLIDMTHGRSFTYSKESLDEFTAQTTRIAVFNKAVSDENYSVYLLK